MNELLVLLGKKFKLDSSLITAYGINRKITQFEKDRGVVLPQDLREYFGLLGDKLIAIDADLYQFYGIGDFKSVGKVLNIRNSENCFIVADYMLHLYDYAIQLYPDQRDENEIYSICGDKYGTIATSFSEFLRFYLDNSLMLKNI